VDALGLVGDRRFLVVDPAGNFLTQRAFPRMALVATTLDTTHLTLSVAAPTGVTAVRVPLAPDASAPLLAVTIWKHTGLLAEDCGAGPAEFLTAFLGAPCRLVRIGVKFHRPILKAAARPGDAFTFADGAPLLAVSEASLADLNDRIIARGGEPVPMDRFRPNVVLADCAALAEDALGRFRIGDAVFRSAGKSIRCILTTTDQATAARGPEPLRTLATYRRDATDSTSVCFGENVINETKSSTVRVGDAVELLA
ncbi:MAG: hypothetical protein RLZZ15_539, partial [Verrucomicrobiota bacterium]